MDHSHLTDADWRLLDDLRARRPLTELLARWAVDESELRGLMSGVAEKLRITASLYGTETVAADSDDAVTMQVPVLDPCPFCDNIAGRFVRTRPPAVVFEDDVVYVFLTRGPLGGMPGHALVCPKRHVETIFDLDADEEAALGQASAGMARALRSVLNPQGLLVQQHNGAAAFQTVPHVHFHVIPKVVGPFPPLTAVPTIPTEDLLELATTLRRHWPS